MSDTEREPKPASPEPGAPPLGVPGATTIVVGSGTPVDGGPIAAEPVRRFKGYVLQGELGRGGMGVVYRAFDPALKRTVAIKTILDARSDPEHARRFQREASAAARLQHPGIVAIHEVGEEDGQAFLVMELVEGETLDRLLQRGPLPPRRVAEIVSQVALALAHAHERGVVHRDVKPENVIVDRAGQPRVTDFGLARDFTGERLTVTGTVLGTPAYMAPEQAAGDREQGPLVDVYALGGLLYRALAGRPPFVAPGLKALMKKVLFEEPTPLRRLDARVHADLETIALRCLAKEPRRRYESAAAVAADLRRFLDGEPIVARPVGRLERAWLWTRRNRGTAAALALVALVGAGGLVVEEVRISVERRDEAARAERARTERLAEVAGVISEARGSGDYAEDNRYRNAVFTLVRGADPEVARLVARALDEQTTALAAAVRETYLAAAQPTADEARAGQVPFVGLDDAVDRWLARGSEEELSVTARSLLAGARGRLEAREARRLRGEAKRFAPTARALAAAAQERRLGPGGLRLTRLACESLGLIQIREGVVPVLASYLRVEQDALRAARAGIALCQLGGDEALAQVLVARDRLSDETIYWRAVGPYVAQAWRTVERPPVTARDFVRRGSVRLGGNDDMAGAIADFTRAIELEPGLAEAWRLRGRVRSNAGDPDGGAADLTKAIELDPRSTAAWKERAEARWLRRDFDGAIEDATRAIELGPHNVDAWRTRAGAREAKGDADGAIADASRALELDPHDAESWYRRALARRRKGDRPGTIEDLTRVVLANPRHVPAWVARASARRQSGDLVGARADLDQAVALAPDDSVGWSGRGVVRLLLGDTAGAIADDARAIQLDPTNAGAWANRGEARRTAHDPGGAIDDCSRAIALDGAFAQPWKTRGAARVDQGDTDGAIADLTTATHLAPEQPDGWVSLGVARCRKRDYAGAIADETRAIDLDPHIAVSYVNRALALRLSGQLDRAMADANRAIELDPSLVEARIERGMGWFARGDRDRALEDLARAGELEPANPRVWRLRAQIRVEGRDFDGAIGDLSRVIELEPDDGRAWMNRAVARGQKGDLDGALADLEQAVALAPRDYRCWVNRANAKEKKGDRAGARADYEHALSLAPPDARGPIEAALSRLRESP